MKKPATPAFGKEKDKKFFEGHSWNEDEINRIKIKAPVSLKIECFLSRHSNKINFSLYLFAVAALIKYLIG